MSDTERRVTVIPPKPQLRQEVLRRQINVAAYCRVSTEEEEQQSSYEAQRSYYTEKIMTNPEWNFVDIFADEGITGTSTRKRDDFNRMIRKCRAGKIDLILTKSISRFARNTVDSLKYIRALKGMGIGIIFEKENINTLETDTELIITFMSAFAQSESESISANVRWGIRQAMKEGKVHVNFNRLYGYRVNDGGEPEIVPEKAEAIQLIFERYLLGDSLRDIKEYLEEKGIPAPDGGANWDTSRISGILENEKYAGDVLRQKTFKADVMSGKTVKNTGQLPMYLIENNHPAIIPREQFNAVQAERLRRSAGRSPSKKNASTGRTSYTSKYALSERLVCGECGTLYRRCTWKRNGKARIVWRCVSRLDYGTKYCKESPTMDEEPLQQAILDAINVTMSPKQDLIQSITTAMTEEVIRLPNSGMTIGEIQQRLEDLSAEFAAVLALTKEKGTEHYMDRFREIAEETKALKAQQEQIAGQLRMNTAEQEKLHIVHSALETGDHRLTRWDEEIIRQLVHTVKVVSKTCIRVYLTDGTEIEQVVVEK